MRRLLSLAILLGLPLLVAGAAPEALQAQGSLRLAKLGGGTVNEAELREGPTIAVVFASWSPRSRDVVAKVNQIQRKWGSKARVVTVNFQEDEATVREFLQGKNLSVPVLMDPDGVFAKKHAVTTLPGLLVFQNGNTAFRGRLGRDPDAIISQVLG